MYCFIVANRDHYYNIMYGEDQLTVTLSRWSHSMITPLSDVRRAVTMTGHRCPWNHFLAAEAGIISPEFSALIYSLLVYVASGVSARVHKSMQRKRLSKRHAANIHFDGIFWFACRCKYICRISQDSTRKIRWLKGLTQLAAGPAVESTISANGWRTTA